MTASCMHRHAGAGKGLMTMNSVVVLVVAKTKAKTLASLYLVVVAVGDGAMACFGTQEYSSCTSNNPACFGLMQSLLNGDLL